MYVCSVCVCVYYQCTGSIADTIVAVLVPVRTADVN